MVTGGIRDNIIQAHVKRIQIRGEFERDADDNIIKEKIQLYGKVLEVLPPLPEPLMQHQSVTLRVSNKAPNCELLVIGGISGDAGYRTISNRVFSIKFNEIYKEFVVISELSKKKNIPTETQDESSLAYRYNWEELAPMAEPRHSFAVCKFDDDVVYVFGGVSDHSKSGTDALAQTIERFSLSKNAWATIQIANAPRLFGFGFAYDDQEESLYIVGGSDGVEKKAETWVINFKESTCSNLNCDI